MEDLDKIPGIQELQEQLKEIKDEEEKEKITKQIDSIKVDYLVHNLFNKGNPLMLFGDLEDRFVPILKFSGEEFEGIKDFLFDDNYIIDPQSCPPNVLLGFNHFGVCLVHIVQYELIITQENLDKLDNDYKQDITKYSNLGFMMDTLKAYGPHKNNKK